MAEVSLTFSVSCKTVPGEHCFLVGSTPQMGSWKPQHAVRMQTSPETYPLWTCTIRMPQEHIGNDPIEYKYVVLKSLKPGSLLKMVVRRWEQLENNRSVVPLTTMCINDGDFSKEKHAAFDSVYLGDHHQLRLTMGNMKDPQQPWFETYFDGIDMAHMELEVSRSDPSMEETTDHWFHSIYWDGQQGEEAHGPVGYGNEIRVWHQGQPQTKKYSRQPHGLVLDLYENKREGSGRTWIAKATIDWRVFRRESDRLVFMFMGVHGVAVAQMVMTSLVLKPLVAEGIDLRFLKRDVFLGGKALPIGHRGFGVTESKSGIAENTLLSFQVARQLGTAFVELDVIVTKDGHPVIHHDFEVPIVTAETNLKVNIPIRALTLAEFQALRPSIHTTPASHRRSRSAPSISNLFLDAVTQPYATLREVLVIIGTSTGLNLEIKYPDSEKERKHLNYPDRNDVVDTVLRMVYELAAPNQDIIFSSFDPDLCIILSAKQPRFPVMFLTHAGTEIFRDPRKNGLAAAVEFAVRNSLSGVVTESTPLVNHGKHWVDLIHSKGLLIFTYGELNNQVEMMKLQQIVGVDAVIHDRRRTYDEASQLE